jgi:TPR repeat protein
VKWWQKSAAQGNAPAQHVLGLSYATGEGVTKDYVTAYMWLDLSNAAGNANAGKARDAVAEKNDARANRMP